MAKKKKKSKKTSRKKTSGKTRKGDLTSTLSKLQKNWKKTKPRQAGVPVPDGQYPARIESVVIEESKSSKRMQVNWGLKIVEGDYENREVHKFSGLETEDNLAFLQGDLETLELAIPDSINDLGEVLTEAAGLLLEINVRTSNEFTNIDFIELLEDEGEEAEEEEEEEEEEESEEEEEEEEEELTKAQVRKMDRDELVDAIDDYDLDVEPDDFKSLSALRRAVTAEL